MDRIKWETHLLSFARSKTSLSQGVSGKIRPPPKNETEAFQSLRSEWSEKVRNHDYLSTSFSKSLSTVSIGLIKGENHRKPWVFFIFHGNHPWFPVDFPTNRRKSWHAGDPHPPATPGQVKNLRNHSFVFSHVYHPSKINQIWGWPFI